MKRPLLAGLIFAFVLLCGAVLSACGGGGGGSLGAPGNIVPPSSPTPCPQGYVGTQPNCQQEASLPGQFTPVAVPSATALPAVAGYAGTILIPAANPAAQVNMTTSISDPTSVGFSYRTRNASKFARVADSGIDTPLLYVALTTSGQVVFTASSNMPGFPGFTFAVPSGAGSGPFYLAYLEGGSTWTTVAGPASPSACAAPLSGSCVTLQPTLPSLTITAQNPVYLLLYTGGVVPSTAPTSSPGGQPTSTASAGASPSAPPTGGGSSASPGSTATPIPGSSSSASPVASPSTSPTVAPTGTRTATPSPTPYVSPTPSPTPTPGSGSASVPKTLIIGALPSNPQSGTSLSFGNGVFSFAADNSSGTAISGSYANAVTLSSSDGTGAVQLSVNGGSPAQSVQVTSGSQLVSISYNGATVTPVTISASATTASPSPVSAVFAPTIAPILFSGPSGSTPEIDLYAPLGQGAGSTFSFTATQAGYTGSFGNNISITGAATCSTFATVSPPAGTSFTVTAIALPSTGSCTITLNGFDTTLNVTLTYSTFGVTLH